MDEEEGRRNASGRRRRRLGRSSVAVRVAAEGSRAGKFGFEGSDGKQL